MTFTDICIITYDVVSITNFYEQVFNTASEGTDIHSSINAGGLTINIYCRKHAEEEMKLDLTTSGNGLVTFGFNVEDVDIEYERLKELGVGGITRPKLWPWGAKSFNFKDIEGNTIFFRSWP